MEVYDYIKTYFTNRRSNGKLGCVCTDFKNPYALDFCVELQTKRKARVYFEALFTKDGVKLTKVYGRKGLTQEQMAQVMESYGAVVKDYTIWKIKNSYVYAEIDGERYQLSPSIVDRLTKEEM